MDTGWRTSSLTGERYKECVEIDPRDTIVAVRDSKDREGPQLHFDRETWKVFVDGVRREG